MFVFCIMHRRPPRSTRTATLCPDTTRCRSSSNARFDCPLLVVFLTSPTRGASYYMGRPRNDHFKLLLTSDNYLCVALTPMLSHDIPNCPILRVGYGKPCQLFDVVGETDEEKRACIHTGRDRRSAEEGTR